MKICKLNMEKLVTSMFIFINSYIGILILKNKRYYGDFSYYSLKLKKEIVIFFILMNIFLFLGSYFLYKKIKIKLLFKNYSIYINKKKLSIFFYVVTLLQIIFYLKTGIGKAGTSKNNSLSFVFNLFNLDCFFLFYYIIARGKNFLYGLNILLYIFYYLIRGWSGIFLFIFIVEGSLFFNKRKLSNLYVSFIPFILIMGGKIYQYLFTLKFYIRENVIYKLTFLDGVNRLLERLSVISNSLVSFQNSEIIKNLYIKQNLKYVEIISFFRPVIPGALMNKDFKILNNLLVETVYTGAGINNSFSLDIISYIYNLYKIGIIELILWIIFLYTIFILYIKLVTFFIEASGQYNLKILIYLYILNFCQNGSLEMNNVGWIKIYFFILVFFLLKIIIIKKNN